MLLPRSAVSEGRLSLLLDNHGLELNFQFQVQVDINPATEMMTQTMTGLPLQLSKALRLDPAARLLKVFAPFVGFFIKLLVKTDVRTVSPDLKEMPSLVDSCSSKVEEEANTTSMFTTHSFKRCSYQCSLEAAIGYVRSLA